jgi:hypothetical protein
MTLLHFFDDTFKSDQRPVETFFYRKLITTHGREVYNLLLKCLESINKHSHSFAF